MAGTIRNSRPLKLAMKYFARGHIWVYQRTQGRLGAKLLWFPAALVTTTGRKSGQPRTTPTLYLRDGDRVVLPASFGGRDNNPSQVHIQIRDQRFDLVARVASDEERKRYWPKLIRMYPPYRGYREATDRVIPLMVCE